MNREQLGTSVEFNPGKQILGLAVVYIYFACICIIIISVTFVVVLGVYLFIFSLHYLEPNVRGLTKLLLLFLII